MKRLKFLFQILTLLFANLNALVIAQNVNKYIKNQGLAGSLQLTNDRTVSSAGVQIFFGDSLLENHAMDAVLSPDGHWLAVEERYSLVIMDTKSRKVVHTLLLKDIPQLNTTKKRAMNTYSGIQWNKVNGSDRISWSTVDGNMANSYVIQVEWDGNTTKVKHLYPFEAKKPAASALPNELIIRQEKNIFALYVVLNGINQLMKLDMDSGKKLWTADTGVAPYGIAVANHKLYVTNWAGRVPEPKDENVAGVPWGKARIDTTSAATREGSISIFDTTDGKLIGELIVGLHPNEITASPDGKFVYLTNSNSDAVSVINTQIDSVVETIPIRLQPDINQYFGDSPNGLTVSADGKVLYVAAGLDNAIAFVQLGKNSATNSKIQKSYVKGFIPTGYYPSSVSVKNKKQIFVTNLEANGPDLAFNLYKGKAVFNSHHALASVSVIDMPSDKVLKNYTKRVIALNQLNRLEKAELAPRPDAKPRPLPERIGEPSVFRHVLYIIKENRTYDQILGDVKKGNGDAGLCTFGEEITPNTHKIVDEYLLMDNFMVSGKCSAEGHQWTDASIVTDYIEKNVRAWFRSYPHVQTDALVYAPTGFLWDNARKHGVSVEIFGEACIPQFDSKLDWKAIYGKYLNNEKFEFKNVTTLNTVVPLMNQQYPGYDSHKIPDVLRAKTFIAELNRYAKMEGDSLPQLLMIALPADHTAGLSPGFPTPRAAVADNDLALGQIVEAFTQSKFYKNSVILITEDDSQDGWDHVSSFRTVGMVISPYSRLRKTISEPYNQPSLVRTIEQILGLPPMNIQDAIATPLWSCFEEKPDFTPFVSVPNRIPLDELNKPLTELKATELHFAKKSMEPQFAGIDSGNDDLMNRILWFAMKRDIPYPAKFAGKDTDD